jgi:hypothetical protein
MSLLILPDVWPLKKQLAKKKNHKKLPKNIAACLVICNTYA